MMIIFCQKVEIERAIQGTIQLLKFSKHYTTNQSGAAEAWWAHNPQVPGSKPGSDT